MSVGISVLLQDESGRTLEEVHDPTNILHRLLPSYEDASYQCLRFIDWYGDTTFNYLQMEPFLAEWAKIAASAAAPNEKELVARTEELARECQNQRLYLKFCGD